MSSESKGTVEEFLDEIDPLIFWGGVAVAVVFIVAYGLAQILGLTVMVNGEPKNAVGGVMVLTNQWLWSNLAWYYLWAMLIFVAFSLFLIFGPWGKIKLGGEDVEPNHSFVSYFAMFFSAGIAAGIVFWGPAESILHFGGGTPLAGENAPAQQRMLGSLVYTFFHWGISAWCAYLIVGVPIAYYAYNKGAPFRFSALLTPFIGADNLEDSNIARFADLIAVFATMGGIATSLGFVGKQLVTGVEYGLNIQIGKVATFAAIVILTIVFTISVVSGVERGIKRLSQLNVLVFLVLGVIVFLVGFPAFVLNLGTSAIGEYLNSFIQLSLFTGVASGESAKAFVGGWTVFYWAWWFSWAPFSGIFLAKISKGRTIREVAFTGVIATTLATVPWFMVVGGTAMKLQASGAANLLGPINEFGKAVAGYPLFGALGIFGVPLGSFLSVLFFLLVVTFFVTSADSSTLGIAMLTTGGKEDPSSINRLVWGVLQGIVAGILVYIGGTQALQDAAVITGGPVAIIGLIGIWGMIKEFSSEYGRVLVQEDVAVRGDEMLIGGSSGGGGPGEPETSSSEDD